MMRSLQYKVFASLNYGYVTLSLVFTIFHNQGKNLCSQNNC